jgi:probable F420-dependent oxidoreductase
VRIDTGSPSDLSSVAAAVRAQEAAGYDGSWVAETSRDPFLPLALAAEHSSTIELGTSIAVAFARSPMTLAATANDLQQYSEGRFLLGLGSQIKAHIEKRFSMPWSHPAARMREFILAMRAIWDCWNNRTKLEFRGEFYTHTLMTPFFDPGPNPFGAPKVYLAGVGELMTEVAGETCDGFIAHGFTTASYLRDVTIPALERGLAKSGRTRADLDVSYPVFIVTGRNDQEFEAAAVGTRKQIAFYGSTPAYKGVLDLHGWGDLQGELNTLSKRGEWDQMGRLITDDILDAFAVVAGPRELPGLLRQRLDGLADRISFYMPYKTEPGELEELVAALKAA